MGCKNLIVHGCLIDENWNFKVLFFMGVRFIFLFVSLLAENVRILCLDQPAVHCNSLMSCVVFDGLNPKWLCSEVTCWFKNELTATIELST